MATVKKAQTGKKLAEVYAKNKPMIDSLQKKNSSILDKQYERQAQAISKSRSKDVETESPEPEIKSKLKAGGKVDKKWIQKAVNPKHKGYCTPMTKATCTPKRKALAKTFKAMGRARKGK